MAQSLQPAGPVAFQTLPPNGHSAQLLTQTSTLLLPEIPALEQPQVPPPEAIESLVRPLIESPATACPPPALVQTEPPQVSEAMALQAEIVLDTIDQRRADVHPAIQGIVASFQEPGKTLLLAPVPEVITAPAPPCLQWMRLPRPRLSPVPPPPMNPGDLMSGFQTPPLAGPCVPRELRNLTELHGAARAKTRRKAGLPAWTVSFLIALILFLGVGSLLQYLAASRDAKAATPAGSQASAEEPVSTEPAPAVVPAPSKLVEVTGLRIANAPNHKPQLAFIVVNHSDKQLSDIGLQIAVRSASSSAGVAPLFRVATTISSLGPYQSREFRAELDPQFRARDIPDWQTLRADVSIR